MPTRSTYTCAGPVRGNCGVTHRSIRAAMAHIYQDQAGCRSQGGYSDLEGRLEGARQETWDEAQADLKEDAQKLVVSITKAIQSATGSLGELKELLS